MTQKHLEYYLDNLYKVYTYNINEIEAMMSKKHKTHEIELSQEELDEVIEQIEEFDDRAFSIFAGTDKYEIVPTVLEDGTLIGKKEMTMLKREVERLGYSIIYRVDHPNGETLLINPKSSTVMVLKEGMQ